MYIDICDHLLYSIHMTDENLYLFFKYYFVHTYKNLNNLNCPCKIIIAFFHINEGFGP